MSPSSNLAAASHLAAAIVFSTSVRRPVLSASSSAAAAHRFHLFCLSPSSPRPRTHSTMAAPTSRTRAEDFVRFLNASPTPFHAVLSAKQRLEKAGFQPIKERDSWSSTLKPGGRYYVTRNASTIIAFAIGSRWKPGSPVAMVGAHTDSPCLRVKPASKRTADGFMQVGVETYGGGMWHTWFDRDLSVAGRVMVKTAGGGMEMRLVRVQKPIMRIPNLAVHFGGSVPFEFNKETQLFPLAGLVSAELNRTGKTAEEAKEEADKARGDAFEPLKTATQRHHPYFVSLVADEAGCKPDDILDFELVLYDTQASCIGGLNDEFVFSARLDNLGMTYCAVEGIIQSLADPSALDDDGTIRLIACFDHEEIGSTSAQGAASNMLPAVLRRLSCLPAASSSSASAASDESFEKVTAGDSAESGTAHEQTLCTSFLVSADMAHSVNPNYSGRYESEHRPEMNAGTVIKVNANVKYATNAPGIVLLQECARRAKPAAYRPRTATATTGGGVPLQLFVVRNDSTCGSTIGPMLSASLGARTIDVGNAQLAMHSIRETTGCYDVEHGVNLFDSFFEHYGELEPKIIVD